MTDYSLQVKEAFYDAMDPLDEETYKALELSCIDDGRIRDAIVIWVCPDSGKRFIVDGHSRYKIATAHNLPFDTDVETLAGKQEKQVITWIWKNQLYRRNLNAQRKKYYRGQLVQAIKHDESSEQSKTQQLRALGKREGVSRASLYRDAEYARALQVLPETLRNPIMMGQLNCSREEAIKLASLAEGDQQSAHRAVRTGQAKSFTLAMSGMKPKKRPPGRPRSAAPKKKWRRPKHGPKPNPVAPELKKAITKLPKLIDKMANHVGGKGPRHQACVDAGVPFFNACNEWLKHPREQ